MTFSTPFQPVALPGSNPASERRHILNVKLGDSAPLEPDVNLINAAVGRLVELFVTTASLKTNSSSFFLTRFDVETSGETDGSSDVKIFLYPFGASSEDSTFVIHYVINKSREVTQINSHGVTGKNELLLTLVS